MDALEAKQYGLVSEVYKHECLHDVWMYLKKISTLSAEVSYSIIFCAIHILCNNEFLLNKWYICLVNNGH